MTDTGQGGQPGPEGPARTVIAVDVGGTAIKAALLDVRATALHTERVPTGAGRGPDAVVATILDLVERLSQAAWQVQAPAGAAGVAVPGVVDRARGVALWSANVGFRDVPLRALVADRLGLPVVVAHDVRAGGLAEARLGAGRGRGNVLFLALGTGISAAHIVDGRVLDGAHHAAGELGHVVVRPGGPPCGCGAHGCLEAVASAAAVARDYTARTGRAVSAAEVVARAATGDPAAAAVWSEAVDALAAGLHTAVALYDPEVVILGGGLAGAGAALLDPLDRMLRERLRFQPAPELVGAALGDRAGCLGAGVLALDLLRTNPAGSPGPCQPPRRPRG